MMIRQDQSEAIAFLSSLSDVTERHDTHISIIILSGKRAYKLKRSVCFPYLDFSTASLRLSACLRELELNRRTAPSLYVAVRRITREASGRLTFDGNGELVDSVVEMVRFDQRDLFSQIAERNELGPTLLSKTAIAIADFHRDAAIDHRRSGSEIMTAVLDMNSESIRAAGIFGADQAYALEMELKAMLDRLGWLLDERERSGKVRRCHGDLHLRNICLLDGSPTLFDCLEFDDDLATIDVLYDLAFLLMDLWGRGLRAEANWVFNRYFDAADEDDGVALLPFFMAVRASVRAHVAGVQVTDRSGAAFKEASAYFELAGDLLNFSPPQLVAVGGLSGSGKSSVAAAAAHRLGPPPGARVLSSDRIRKRLYGVPAETRLPPEAYQPGVSKRVYAEQARTAATFLKSGHAVIADAVFDRAEDRQRIEAAVPDTVPFNGFWLDAPLELLIDRVSRRIGDPSDATPSVLRQQANSATQTEWQSLSSSEGIAKTAAMLIKRVQAAPDMAER
ncbi:AAA family ATPase [Hyphomicrobium sp. 99]|uniref:bifunctional aminoglycoside phosphotransferase/ATP-binding protein n=1 Tax=Hyphomicrobium sp. 99 TaxID=1163419 RepID=UPI001FD94BDD|nr:AAA family ATPase [Hyphomicrobium sp. 99]